MGETERATVTKNAVCKNCGKEVPLSCGVTEDNKILTKLEGTCPDCGSAVSVSSWPDPARRNPVDEEMSSRIPVRIESGPRAPHAAIGSRVMIQLHDQEEEVPMGFVKRITVDMSTDNAVIAQIEVFPEATEIEALARFLVVDQEIYYRGLLEAYMLQVMNCEGISFLDNGCNDGRGFRVPWAPQGKEQFLKKLKRIEKELRANGHY